MGRRPVDTSWITFTDPGWCGACIRWRRNRPCRHHRRAMAARTAEDERADQLAALTDDDREWIATHERIATQGTHQDHGSALWIMPPGHAIEPIPESWTTYDA